MHLRFLCSNYGILRVPYIFRQFSFLGNMNPGRNCNPTSNSIFLREYIGADGPDGSAGSMLDNVLKQTKSTATSDTSNEKEWPSVSTTISSGSKGKRRTRIDLRTEQRLDGEPGDVVSFQLETSPRGDSKSQQDESSLPSSFGKKRQPQSDWRPTLKQRSSFGKKRQPQSDWRPTLKQRSDEGPGNVGSLLLETSPTADSKSHQDESSLPTSFEKKRVIFSHWQPKLARRSDGIPGNVGSLQLETSPAVDSKSQQDESSLPTSFGKERGTFSNWRPKLFDICLSKIRKYGIHRPLLCEQNRENWVEVEHSIVETRQILRAGMVLLKSYIALSEQVEIVKKCQELGLGPGGFYQPGYQDGAKLRLQMMCLGMNWDPRTRKYEDRRQTDDCEPPGIPQDFIILVNAALQDSQALIKKHLRASNVEDLLPGMSPDICIVNFYTKKGRLGLHQDRDESPESLIRGLPVVSFSVGDTAEFLYGDQRDVNKAEKVLLESGDVLIFGGKSRHIFHGVTSIVPNSAPLALLKEAKLRPGRLNLTFRQF